MHKEINRLRIMKLYTENNIFKPIEFKDGINLILGEKSNNSNVSGRKTNGVGKSMSIEFLDFCFLSDYSSSRIKKIPDSVVPLEEYILLDLSIGIQRMTIKRNRKDEAHPIFIVGKKSVSFNKLEEARKYLSDLLFNPITQSSIPSLRSLLSLIIRDERSEFLDILANHDASKRIPIDLTPHLFLLGLDINMYHEVLSTIKQIDDITTVINSNKKELTSDNKKIPEIQAELNEINNDLKKMETAIDSFKSNDAFDSMQLDLIELERMLEQLRSKQKVLKYEYKKIREMPEPDEIDDFEIEIVYNYFKEELGSAVVKSLKDVIGFKNKVEDFQRVLINEKAKDLERELGEISEMIKDIDNEYAEKINILDQKGVLKNLKTTLRIYEEKKKSSAHTQYLFSCYEKNMKKKEQLSLKKSQGILDIGDLLAKNNEKIVEFEKTLLDIHEKIMGNKMSSFKLETENKTSSKKPIRINFRIYDDGSHSVNRTKVFIYDTGLLFDEYTNKNHPKLLVHDNIFDVDQDTLVQSLNFMYEQEMKNYDFQYILTLNRDKIENEERLKLIKMNIEEHKVAVFTKDNKFLSKSYQEG